MDDGTTTNDGFEATYFLGALGQDSRGASDAREVQHTGDAKGSNRANTDVSVPLYKGRPENEAETSCKVGVEPEDPVMAVAATARDEPTASTTIPRPSVQDVASDEDALDLIMGWVECMNPRTAADYRNRARGRLDRLELTLRKSEFIISDVYRFAESLGGKSPSSIQQYRSALLFVLGEHLVTSRDDIDMQISLMAFRAAEDRNTWPAARKTASRAKAHGVGHMPARDLERLKAALRFSRSPRAHHLANMLDVLVVIGARPCELRTGVVIGSALPATLVQLHNGKHDEFQCRTHGPTRDLRFEHLPVGMHRRIEEIFAYAAQFSAAEWDHERGRLQNLLKITSRRLWPTRRRSYTLYDCRHQFCANMLLALGTDPDASVKVAYMMGHGQDSSHRQHYARAGKGAIGAVVPDLAPAAVADIRKTYETSLERLYDAHWITPRDNPFSM